MLYMFVANLPMFWSVMYLVIGIVVCLFFRKKCIWFVTSVCVFFLNMLSYVGFYELRDFSRNGVIMWYIFSLCLYVLFFIGFFILVLYLCKYRDKRFALLFLLLVFLFVLWVSFDFVVNMGSCVVRVDFLFDDNALVLRFNQVGVSFELTELGSSLSWRDSGVLWYGKL